MEVKFQTKAESKRQQQEDFLKLSGGERFLKFLELSRRINKLFPPKNQLSFEERYKGNFLLIHKNIQDDEMG
ncbi:hypothetical protein [Psychroflexus sp. MBR-150]|jgi:hypothetical protein